MAQRLLRVICDDCKSPYNDFEQTALSNATEKITIKDAQLYEGLGCDCCLGTGYYGRTGIFELLTIDDDIKELIIKQQHAHVIKEAAVSKGMNTLRDDGLSKALTGITSLQEVYRVTQDSTGIITGVAERVGS